ncbi:cupin domain-containing protein [Micrococcoides hystricis]|uniref:Cupin domain-containing protein n=1 Tax=Micrococcoides hystricis TaxID=1572761 RepID=A0ABV6P8H2_9MICC
MADLQFRLDEDPESRGHLLNTFDVLQVAPPPRDRAMPSISRLFEGDGANLIAITFVAGQVLADHRAAHPITVQAICGEVRFMVADRVETLTPGVVVHLPEMVVHRLESVQDSVVLLTMLTGERHQDLSVPGED